MIPFLLKHWRWFAWGAVLGAAVWFLLLVRHWHADSERLPVVEAELAAERLCEADSACAKRAATLALQAAQEAAEAAAEAVRGAAAREEQARADAAAWRAKYRQAVQDDPGCAEWAAGAVKCPL